MRRDRSCEDLEQMVRLWIDAEGDAEGLKAQLGVQVPS